MSGVREKISHHMREKGWSVVTTSERSGVPVATIKSIIYGKKPATQRITTLEKLAKVFDCTVNDLITEENVAEVKKLDVELFKECLDAVELYLKHKDLDLHKEKLMRVIESLSSLLLKKKIKNLPYAIDDDTIEWIIDNTK